MRERRRGGPRPQYRQAPPSPGKGTLGTVSGYCAVFYNAQDPGTEYQLMGEEDGGPRVMERIVPGAFDLGRQDDIVCLVNHEMRMSDYVARTSNRTLRLRVDGKGLYYSATIPPTQAGHDLVALLGRGDISGSSFSFVVEDERYSQPSASLVVREIRRVRLLDTSPCLRPAYAATSAGFSGTSDTDLMLYGPLRAADAGPLSVGRMRLRLAELECA